MVIGPAAAIIIAQAISSAAKAGGEAIGAKKEKKAAKRRSKEMKRETHADLLNESLNRGAELEAHRLKTSGNMAKRKGQSFNDTADTVRGALNI
jgi:hypothetical protein